MFICILSLLSWFGDRLKFLPLENKCGKMLMDRGREPEISIESVALLTSLPFSNEIEGTGLAIVGRPTKKQPSSV